MCTNRYENKKDIKNYTNVIIKNIKISYMTNAKYILYKYYAKSKNLSMSALGVCVIVQTGFVRLLAFLLFPHKFATLMPIFSIEILISCSFLFPYFQRPYAAVPKIRFIRPSPQSNPSSVTRDTVNRKSLSER